MDVFKLRINDTGSISITRENFELQTKQQPPWYQSLDGKKESHLAICPACDNTITITGLHSSNTEIDEKTGKIQHKESRSPHGRHYLYKQLDNLGVLDREAYENCPYSGKATLSPRRRHSARSPIPSRVLAIMEEDFDRVFYLLKKSIGINFSYRTAKEMLTRYKQAEGWKYAGATVMNIPWIFGYFSRSTSLLYQSIGNKNMREAIQQHYPSATFTGEQFKLERTTQYINPCLHFENHTRKTINEHLEESIDLVVTDDNRNDLYRETIKFDPLHFVNLVNSSDTKNRSESYIELGRSTLQN
ncbi:hypothetical protein [Aliivibrio fischeri]|uniref:Uncharacterized protein n=1 Tax=Aliivibrio fischeri TaxID=668 RepID=A0A510UM93_ALIFS|nr:hypothetical protein [Aliivibrio fischeri]GEK15747.1 hypothetical protein AFI02nite_37830 [Aliivibrio fischeri]